MIADRIERLQLYYGMHPNLDKVILALRGMDLDDMPNGRHEISGEDVFLNIMDTELKPVTAWEAHRNYIDLQLVLKHEETIAWAPIDQISGFSAYDAARDIQLCEGNQQGSPIRLQKGMFGIFFPEDAHMPGLGSGKGRKAVFKIKVLPTATAAAPTLLNHQGTRELRTKRLVLRQYRVEDAQEVFDNWCSDPRVADRVTWHPHSNVSFTEALISDWVRTYPNPQYYHWVIEEDSRVIGDIAAVGVSDRLMTCEIGYCLGHDHWNQGILTEALIRVMRYLFLEVGFHRIIARHFVSNPASGRVMEKAGMVKEGLNRQYRNVKDGSFEDLVQYAALREEWLTNQG
ncbi:MAG: DUF386 family protein [Clostridiales bacterium]|nr:DUF386 family protein [Clostridiales bacterium]